MRYLALLLFLALAPVRAANTDLAGRFAGDWKSSGAGGGGTFRMSLESGTDGWKCEVSFEFAGQEVKTKNCAAKVEQGKLDAAYDFDLAGNLLRSKISGRWSGKGFEGQYHTTAVDGGAAVDEGTWTAARAN